MTNLNNKLRVYWIPQIGVEKMMTVEVKSPEEGWKLLQVLAVYDLYQLEQNVKPDFCNIGGLQYYDEDTEDWENWYDDNGDDIDSFTDALEEAGFDESSSELEKWKDKLFTDNLGGE